MAAEPKDDDRVSDSRQSPVFSVTSMMTDDDPINLSLSLSVKPPPARQIDPSQYTRHVTHYFDDGNVIFIVESTLFRLYRGLLSRHSEIMRNMFSFPPHPTEAQDEMYGVPAITLDDTSDDFACLLDFLLSPNIPPYPRPAPSFETCLSLLRIASKYCFDDIFEGAVWHLRQMLPTTLEDFVANPGLPVFTELRAAQVISAARQFNLPEFIPLALYAITTYGWGGELLPAEQVLSALPQQDIARIVVGRTALHNEALKLAFTMHEHGLVPHTYSTNSSSIGCTNPISHSRTCARGKPAMLWMNPQEALEEFLRNPLRQLVIRDRCEFHSLCKSCVDGVRAKMASDLEMFFAKLPALLMLTPTPDVIPDAQSTPQVV